jgi:hypothetical protein
MLELDQTPRAEAIQICELSDHLMRVSIALIPRITLLLTEVQLSGKQIPMLQAPQQPSTHTRMQIVVEAILNLAAEPHIPLAQTGKPVFIMSMGANRKRLAAVQEHPPQEQQQEEQVRRSQ